VNQALGNPRYVYLQIYINLSCRYSKYTILPWILTLQLGRSLGKKPPRLTTCHTKTELVHGIWMVWFGSVPCISLGLFISFQIDYVIFQHMGRYPFQKNAAPNDPTGYHSEKCSSNCTPRIVFFQHVSII